MKKLLTIVFCLVSTCASAQYGYPGPRPPYPLGPYQPYSRSPESRPREFYSGPRPFYDDGAGYYRERGPYFGPPGNDRGFIRPYGYPPPGYPYGGYR